MLVETGPECKFRTTIPVIFAADKDFHLPRAGPAYQATANQATRPDTRN